MPLQCAVGGCWGAAREEHGEGFRFAGLVVGSSHCLEVKVRRGGVSGIATCSDDLADPNRVSYVDFQAAVFEVC